MTAARKARGAQIYRGDKGGSCQSGEPYSMPKALSETDTGSAAADRIHPAARFVRSVLDLAPALKDSFDLDDLARR